ncbi:PP2C family protein-serine/threonine phosphatase [Halopseudomonas sp.]|uniref:PP2C family protein-serine/threonine phosphatase n=1 Tax=Halopseudomonas sp. TaxID=2901191 RepID=UPI003564877A
MQLTGTTLLVIDDDEASRRDIATRLQNCGFDVLQAGSAADGQEQLASQRPELILCNLYLPEKDGFADVLQAVLANPETSLIVIAPTTDMPLAVKALRAGAHDFLIKPLVDTALVELVVKRTLDQSRLRNENRRIRERLEAANRELEDRLQELKDDQAAGHQVQINMLPESPWVSGEYTFERRIIPSLYLSGDFVDYFRISETQLGFYLADVSGHGASSAFATVLLKFMTTRLLYEQRRQGDGSPIEFLPSDVLEHINRGLINCKLGKHVTMLGGIIDESSNTLTYSIGGHLPLPLLYANGKAHYLQGKGRPVGLFDDAVYENHKITLPDAFSLILCSDGVLDCIEGATLRNKEAQLPGLVEQCNGSMKALLGSFGLQPGKVMPDDISLMVLSRNRQ